MFSIQSTIFVVEDDQKTSAVLREWLDSESWHVVPCATAEEFIKRNEGQRPACVILDQRLPDTSSTDVQVRLQKSGVALPVIVLAGISNTRLTVEAMQLGASTVLEKPCTEKQVRDAVASAIQHDQQVLQKETRTEAARHRLSRLSEGERDVLMLVLEGLPNKQIAKRLGISVRGVETRRSRIYQHVGVDSVARLVRICVAAGMIDA